MVSAVREASPCSGKIRVQRALGFMDGGGESSSEHPVSFFLKQRHKRKKTRQVSLNTKVTRGASWGGCGQSSCV